MKFEKIKNKVNKQYKKCFIKLSINDNIKNLRFVESIKQRVNQKM